MTRPIVPLTGILFLLLTSPAWAGKYNEVLEIGDRAPAWTDLPGVDGRKHSLADLKDKEVVVVVFTCNSCPIATDYEDRIIDFANRHAGADSKVGVVAINVNTVPADLLPKMKERAQAKKFPYPYLYDETQKIARDYGAIFTPEFYVLDKQRRVVYMGGRDDSSNPDKVRKKYLEPAVAAALAGKRPETTETVAIGCRVRYVRTRRK
jgi:peroxiredoxin